MSRVRRPIACTLVGLCIAPIPALSQSDPFETAMQDALAEAGLAASLIRCTSLYRAFRIYAGEETDLGAAAAERETALAAASVVIWQSDTGSEDVEAAFGTIVPMVGDATILFLARMNENREADASVFDPGLETELAYCGTLHDEIATRGSE